MLYTIHTKECKRREEGRCNFCSIGCPLSQVKYFKERAAWVGLYTGMFAPYDKSEEL